MLLLLEGRARSCIAEQLLRNTVAGSAIFCKMLRNTAQGVAIVLLLNTVQHTRNAGVVATMFKVQYML
jgi:hypothetical protein